jgi:hypothetical protein
MYPVAAHLKFVDGSFEKSPRAAVTLLKRFTDVPPLILLSVQKKPGEERPSVEEIAAVKRRLKNKSDSV